VLKSPFDLDIYNLIDDLRNFSWEASETMLYYSRKINNLAEKKKIVRTKVNEDPVTLADLKVNELIIKRINEKFNNFSWDILSEENVKFSSKSLKPTPEKDWLWVLDPLDGTKDFIQGTGNYAMHLALNFRRKPLIGVVLIPEKNELFITDGKKVWFEKSDGSPEKIHIPENKKLFQMTLVASKNHRNHILESLIQKIKFKKVITMGSVGCKIASILRGESDIYISISLPGQGCPKDWDFAAPEAVLRAAGGAITNLNNQDLVYGKKNFEQGGIIIASNNATTHESICKRIKEIILEFDLLPAELLT
jgi:3'(2'), 5'-bisphosphate nucleotidase